jgi:hypothetical protein
MEPTEHRRPAMNTSPLGEFVRLCRRFEPSGRYVYRSVRHDSLRAPAGRNVEGAALMYPTYSETRMIVGNVPPCIGEFVSCPNSVFVVALGRLEKPNPFSWEAARKVNGVLIATK